MSASGSNQGKGLGGGGGTSALLIPTRGGRFFGVIAAALGILTSFGLFWIMQELVSSPFEMGEAGKKLSVEFVRLRKDTTPEEKEREKPKKQKPEQQPPPPEMNMAQNMNPGDAVGAIVPIIDTGAQLAEATNLAGGGSNRAPVPLVQVDPDYPERARQQGIEGWVEVEFTISQVGTVVDATVIGSKPPMVFDRVAIQAVRRWKYNPMIKDGLPIARTGMRTRFEFNKPSGSR